ncbi:MAG: hypothetical protein CVV04_08765 [Firmicutes bacterium HGW-Firmicutes-9]|nr:MAG: hypothetical protein CVV04_08765 [Firmicutes bacterium HGW-Firmicutes-9]
MFRLFSEKPGCTMVNPSSPNRNPTASPLRTASRNASSLNAGVPNAASAGAFQVSGVTPPEASSFGSARSTTSTMTTSVAVSTQNSALVKRRLLSCAQVEKMLFTP